MRGGSFRLYKENTTIRTKVSFVHVARSNYRRIRNVPCTLRSIIQKIREDLFADLVIKGKLVRGIQGGKKIELTHSLNLPDEFSRGVMLLEGGLCIVPLGREGVLGQNQKVWMGNRLKSSKSLQPGEDGWNPWGGYLRGFLG